MHHLFITEVQSSKQKSNGKSDDHTKVNKKNNILANTAS